MKTLKTTMKLMLVVLIAGGILYSCSEQDVVSPEDDQVSASVKAQFEDLGFNVSDIDVIDGYNPLTGEDGPDNYLLEGDIIVSPSQLQNMLDGDVHHVGVVEEQYRTTNLVQGLPRTINVIGYTGGFYALDSKMRTALSWAIDNYNALNTGLTFTLTFGTNYQPYDIVVYRTFGPGGGSAGFPENGNPYKFVQIQSGTSQFSTNVVEHVMTHEIGHCVGMRHTDWFNRSLSCGSGGSEGQAGVGAIYIAGTPEGFDPNSVMLSCFSTSEDGEFGPFDVVALETLY